MDSGALQVDRLVPQGPHTYVPGGDGRWVLREEPEASARAPAL